MTVRVLLADDHRLVREALRDTLSKVIDIEVVGEAGVLAPDVIERMTASAGCPG